jgi:hypothetical protein
MWRLSVVVIALIVTLSAAGQPASAQSCTFTLGFKALHHLIPGIVGDCTSDESHGPNGDGLQETVNGLLVWRAADNWTAFTNGSRTWINGPCGLQDRPNADKFPWEMGLPCSAARLEDPIEAAYRLLNYIPSGNIAVQVTAQNDRYVEVYIFGTYRLENGIGILEPRVDGTWQWAMQPGPGYAFRVDDRCAYFPERTFCGGVVPPPSPFSAAAVWDGFDPAHSEAIFRACGTDFWPDIDAGQPCIVDAMSSTGATEEAIRFFRATQLFLIGFEERGRIDTGSAASVWFNMGRTELVFLNGALPATPLDWAAPSYEDWRNSAEYRAIAAQYPDIDPWYEYVQWVESRDIAGGSGSQIIQVGVSLQYGRPGPTLPVLPIDFLFDRDGEFITWQFQPVQDPRL